MKRTYKYRAYLNKTTEQNARRWLWRLRTVYNIALANRIWEYKYNEKTVSNYDQYYIIKRKNGMDGLQWIGIDQVNIRVLQDCLKRLHLAYQAFFRKVKQGLEKPGFPKFAASRSYRSFTLDLNGGKPAGWKLEGNRLHVKGVGVFKLKLHRPMTGKIKTVNVSVGRDQKWHVSFSCDDVEIRTLPMTGKSLEIKMERPWFGICSDGSLIREPEFYRQAEKEIAKRQRIVSQRKKGSNRRRKARIQLAKYHAYVRRRRDDYIKNKACSLLRKYDEITLNKLEVSEDVKKKNHRNSKNDRKAILDNSWAMFVAHLDSRAEGCGKKIYFQEG